MCHHVHKIFIQDEVWTGGASDTVGTRSTNIPVSYQQHLNRRPHPLHSTVPGAPPHNLLAQHHATRLVPAQNLRIARFTSADSTDNAPDPAAS